MQVLIIEDEKPAARRLCRMLESLDVSVSTLLHSVSEAVAWFEQNEHPDLIFLDIQLSDGLSFEIFDSITINSAIIFTTAYDEYALQAFKLNSVDYLLKPVDQEDLQIAVKKYRSSVFTAQNIQLNFKDIEKMLAYSPVEREYKKRFTVKIGQHIKMIPIDEIECFYSENKGTYAHTTENRNYLLDKPLEVLEDELDPGVFFRVSRKYFVNINYIKDIVAYTNSRLQIKINSFTAGEIIVSRERVKDFKLWLE